MYKKWHSIQGSVLSGVSGIHWEGLDPTSAEKEGPLCINFFSHYSNYIIFRMYWGIIYIMESTRMLYVETMIFPISIYLYNRHPVRGRGHLCSPARSLPLSPSKRLPREVTLPWPPSPQFVLSVLEIYVIWICKTHTFHFIYFFKCNIFKRYKSVLSLLALASSHSVLEHKGNHRYQLLVHLYRNTYSYTCKCIFVNMIFFLAQKFYKILYTYIHSVLYLAFCTHTHMHTSWILFPIQDFPCCHSVAECSITDQSLIDIRLGYFPLFAKPFRYVIPHTWK